MVLRSDILRQRMRDFLALLDRSKYRDRFVLRGGLLMDSWFPGQRAVADLDLLALFSLPQADEAISDIASGAAAEFKIQHAETTWQESPWPGRRYQLGALPLQLDVGAEDPLVVPPERRQVEGVTVLCCAPEVMYGWKAHGLFERGRGLWRPRDLFDLYLLQSLMAMDMSLLTQSVGIAFSSRNTPFTVADRFFQDEWGRSPGSIKKWKKFRSQCESKCVPDDLFEVRDAIAKQLGEIIKQIEVSG